jgi:chromosome segregation ATPase
MTNILKNCPGLEYKMTDDPSDARLSATELQMRRALGLDRETSHASQATHSSNPSNGPHQRRQFARDGDVPVTIVHSDSGSRLQQLDTARQALRQQTAAREEAERLLADARNTIHDLETKLGHEQLAKDELTRRIDAEKREIEEALASTQEELAAERARCAAAERERDEAVVATQTAQQRLRQRTVVKAALPPPATFPSDHQPPRRRGRPPKVARQEVGSDDSEIVKWWSPGWKEKYR